MKQLDKINDLQQQIRHIHPLLEHLYPIGIADGKNLSIFDTLGYQTYFFIKTVQLGVEMPVGIRAAFNIDEYDKRAICVVSEEAFDSPEGCVDIFHEFVHCYQAETCEDKLREKLEIYQIAMQEKHYTWELDYPFPYANKLFSETYQQFLEGTKDILLLRKPLHQLKYQDLEYLCWQEWKEGFARFIENKIGKQLGLAENHFGSTAPFDRIAFYAGGARFIEYLVQRQPELYLDNETLYDCMCHLTWNPHT